MEPFLTDEELEALDQEPVERRIELLEELERRIQAALADEPGA